ncbi:hypothetical protein HMN09_01364500 [Mycena chlorophos]|uniref:Uncharacterized protein n=1 Tax=Mycena chlorophos TaxID=658473 RepID=A0A8H6VR08_MYCCL|nr:hypothetical protein HMN09_01364500 [Mycena chlorophos]
MGTHNGFGFAASHSRTGPLALASSPSAGLLDRFYAKLDGIIAGLHQVPADAFWYAKLGFWQEHNPSSCDNCVATSSPTCTSGRTQLTCRQCKERQHGLSPRKDGSGTGGSGTRSTCSRKLRFLFEMTRYEFFGDADADPEGEYQRFLELLAHRRKAKKKVAGGVGGSGGKPTGSRGLAPTAMKVLGAKQDRPAFTNDDRNIDYNTPVHQPSSSVQRATPIPPPATGIPPYPPSTTTTTNPNAGPGTASKPILIDSRSPTPESGPLSTHSLARRASSHASSRPGSSAGLFSPAPLPYLAPQPRRSQSTGERTGTPLTRVPLHEALSQPRAQGPSAAEMARRQGLPLWTLVPDADVDVNAPRAYGVRAHAPSAAELAYPYTPDGSYASRTGLGEGGWDGHGNGNGLGMSPASSSSSTPFSTRTPLPYASSNSTYYSRRASSPDDRYHYHPAKRARACSSTPSAPTPPTTSSYPGPGHLPYSYSPPPPLVSAFPSPSRSPEYDYEPSSASSANVSLPLALPASGISVLTSDAFAMLDRGAPSSSGGATSMSRQFPMPRLPSISALLRGPASTIDAEMYPASTNGSGSSAKEGYAAQTTSAVTSSGPIVTRPLSASGSSTPHTTLPMSASHTHSPRPAPAPAIPHAPTAATSRPASRPDAGGHVHWSPPSAHPVPEPSADTERTSPYPLRSTRSRATTATTTTDTPTTSASTATTNRHRVTGASADSSTAAWRVQPIPATPTSPAVGYSWSSRSSGLHQFPASAEVEAEQAAKSKPVSDEEYYAAQSRGVRAWYDVPGSVPAPLVKGSESRWRPVPVSYRVPRTRSPSPPAGKSFAYASSYPDNTFNNTFNDNTFNDNNTFDEGYTISDSDSRCPTPEYVPASICAWAPMPNTSGLSQYSYDPGPAYPFERLPVGKDGRRALPVPVVVETVEVEAEAGKKGQKGKGKQPLGSTAAMQTQTEPQPHWPDSEAVFETPDFVPTPANPDGQGHKPKPKRKPKPPAWDVVWEPKEMPSFVDTTAYDPRSLSFAPTSESLGPPSSSSRSSSAGTGTPEAPFWTKEGSGWPVAPVPASDQKTLGQRHLQGVPVMASLGPPPSKSSNSGSGTPSAAASAGWPSSSSHTPTPASASSRSSPIPSSRAADRLPDLPALSPSPPLPENILLRDVLAEKQKRAEQQKQQQLSSHVLQGLKATVVDLTADSDAASVFAGMATAAKAAAARLGTNGTAVRPDVIDLTMDEDDEATSHTDTVETHCDDPDFSKYLAVILARASNTGNQYLNPNPAQLEEARKYGRLGTQMLYHWCKYNRCADADTRRFFAGEERCTYAVEVPRECVEEVRELDARGMGKG